jgi:hypothetical protein
MRPTSISTNQTQQAAPPRPADCLVYLIVNLLAPMFLGITAGNLNMARTAAAEALKVDCAETPTGLLAAAQIIAFGLAALGSLSLSMADDITPAMAMRLRANANACDRSAEQNRRALSRTRATTAQHAEPLLDPEPPPATGQPGPFHATPAEPFAAAAATQDRPLHPDQPSPAGDKRYREMWAIAYTKEAGEIEASLPHLPPAAREQASLRAGALRSAANHLLTGVASNPRPAAPRP